PWRTAGIHPARGTRRRRPGARIRSPARKMARRRCSAYLVARSARVARFNHSRAPDCEWRGSRKVGNAGGTGFESGAARPRSRTDWTIDKNPGRHGFLFELNALLHRLSASYFKASRTVDVLKPIAFSLIQLTYEEPV